MSNIKGAVLVTSRNSTINLKLQRPLSATTATKEDYRSLRSKVVKILKENFATPSRTKPPIPSRRRSEDTFIPGENKDSYKQIHTIEELFKKSRKTEIEMAFKKKKSLSIALPKYIDMKIAPNKSKNNLEETEYIKEKHEQDLPNVEKLCKLLNAEEIEQISKDPHYFFSVNEYRNYAPLTDPKKWAYFAGSKLDEDSENKSHRRALSTERQLSNTERKRPISAISTSRTPKGFFRTSQEGDQGSTLSAEEKKELNVEYLKADRERRLQRHQQRKKIESYREAERVGTLLKQFEVRMKKAVDIEEMFDKVHRETLIASHQKLDEMHIILDRTRKKLEEDAELKRINYNIKKNLTERTTTKNKELFIFDKINRNHLVSRSGMRSRASTPRINYL